MKAHRRTAVRLRNLPALVSVVTLIFSPAISRAERASRHSARHRVANKRTGRSKPAVQKVTIEAFGSLGTSEEHVHIQNGDTLERLLAAHGINGGDAAPWLNAANGVRDLRQLKPKRGITMIFDRATHALMSMRCEIDEHTMLTLERSGDEIHARREALPYFVELKGIAGRIEKGLREDATESGVPERVVADLAEIFGWDMDVSGGLKPGDRFRLIYENIWETGGSQPEPGNIVGAELITSAHAEPLTAVYYEDTDGKSGYYRPSGDALARTFLRFPVEFTEITSEFSLFRLHPILGRSRPHYGIDLAAPRGTPVRAVADGTVAYSGWVRQLGRCVRIDHADAIESAYGHLARIVSGIEPGTAVERGQVIGFVGSSGLSTGPHLHYALEKDGEFLDPMAQTAPQENRVADAERRGFERVQRVVVQQLAQLPETGGPQTLKLALASFRE